MNEERINVGANIQEQPKESEVVQTISTGHAVPVPDAVPVIFNPSLNE